MRHLHLALAAAWALALLPAVLWWSESVLFVAVLQVYQVVVGHLSAWQAARAEAKEDEILDEVARRPPVDRGA